MADSLPAPAPAPVAFTGPIGRRIRYYRLQSEMTQNALATKAGVNQGYLSEIERGRRNPSPAAMKAIAVALDVPPAILIGEGPEHDTPRPLETMPLPLLDEIPLVLPGRQDPQLEMFPVLRHLWAPNRYVLRLTLDAMEPTLKPGDLLLIECRPGVRAEHVQGRICACLVDHAPTLKRVSVELKGGHLLIILRGDNPESAPVLVGTDQEFSIQGVVTHLVSRAL